MLRVLVFSLGKRIGDDSTLSECFGDLPSDLRLTYPLPMRDRFTWYGLRNMSLRSRAETRCGTT